MNNILNYKGFASKIEFSADENVFVGRVLGVEEIIVFHGETVKELREQMEGMIDFYLETCEKSGKNAKKTYNGKLLFRLPSELHAEIETAAARSGKSINEWGKEVLEAAVKSH